MLISHVLLLISHFNSDDKKFLHISFSLFFILFVTLAYQITKYSIGQTSKLY